MANEDASLSKELAERAENYVTDSRALVPGHAAIYDMALALLSERVPEGCKLLVVGAGGGSELVAFGAACPGWKLTGVDPSQAMLSVARSRAEQQGIGEQVETVCGTVADLSADRRFHAATCILVLHFVKDDGSKLEFLKEVGKRLSTGAPLVLVDMCGTAGSEEHSQQIAGWRAHGRRNGKSAEFMDDFETTVMTKVHFVSEKRELELLKDAGFRVGFQFFRAFCLCGWIAFKERD